MMRIFAPFILSLLLAVTSVSMAMARVQMLGAQTLTLCSNGSAVTVTLDTQGNPLPASSHHHCPDCLAGLTLGPLPQPARSFGPTGRTMTVVFMADRRAKTMSLETPQARGPPSLI